MSDVSSLPVPRLRADGCIEFGATVIEPWPSLRMTPVRSLVCTDGIIWAKPGDPLWAFTEKIPPPLLCLVKSVSGICWELLELAAASPQHEPRMLIECPALAVLLLENIPTRHPDRLGYLREILRRRWHDIVCELGLPRQRHVVRLLRKVPILHCHRLTVLALADAIEIKHPHLRKLSHMPRITRDTIGLLRLPPERVNPYLLLASSQSDWDEEPITSCVDTVNWFRECEAPGRPWPYGLLSAQELTAVEKSFRAQFDDETLRLTPFPEPPIAGVPGRITALRDSSAVVMEGEAQQNCAESYLSAIVKGDSYLYSITVLEPATLALERDAMGRWVIEELRAAGNQPPSRETEEFVITWLTEYNCRQRTGEEEGQ